MTQLTANFTSGELACKHCGKMLVPQSSVERLQRVRDAMGVPLKITSGYRCPTHNEAVSESGPNGPHTKGAFDIQISGPAAFKLVCIALKEGFTGIGFSQKGPHDQRFIHLDDLPDATGQTRPTVWSY